MLLLLPFAILGALMEAHGGDHLVEGPCGREHKARRSSGCELLQRCTALASTRSACLEDIVLVCRFVC